MKKYFSILLILICSDVNYAQGIKSPFCIGAIDTIYSEILSEKRIINVYLPNGYSINDTVKYPVIYLLDGSKDEDFIHVAGLVQYLSFPWINNIKPSIVVGIANVDRRRDFTFPTTIQKDKNDFPTTGASAKFIDFLEKELQPYIGLNYKVSEKHTLVGQSFGGLLATEVLFKKPYLFDKYIIVSPSLWWDNESLLKFKPDFSKNKTIDIHISVGNEGDVMVRDARALFHKLNGIGKIRADFKYYNNMKHETIYHIALYNAFVWLNSIDEQ